MVRPLRLILFAVLFLMAALPLRATQFVWTNGGGDGYFSNPLNWDQSAVPMAGDDAYIGTNGSCTDCIVELGPDTPSELASLSMDDGAQIVSQGPWALYANTLNIYGNGAKCVVNLQNGNYGIGYFEVGTLIFNGGELEVSGTNVQIGAIGAYGSPTGLSFRGPMTVSGTFNTATAPSILPVTVFGATLQNSGAYSTLNVDAGSSVLNGTSAQAVEFVAAGSLQLNNATAATVNGDGFISCSGNCYGSNWGASGSLTVTVLSTGIAEVGTLKASRLSVNNQGIYRVKSGGNSYSPGEIVAGGPQSTFDFSKASGVIAFGQAGPLPGLNILGGLQAVSLTTDVTVSGELRLAGTVDLNGHSLIATGDVSTAVGGGGPLIGGPLRLEGAATQNLVGVTMPSVDLQINKSGGGMVAMYNTCTVDDLVFNTGTMTWPTALLVYGDLRSLPAYATSTFVTFSGPKSHVLDAPSTTFTGNVGVDASTSLTFTVSVSMPALANLSLLRAPVGQTLYVRSDIPGIRFDIGSGPSNANIANVYVRDCQATNPVNAVGTGSTDGGNNVNWTFVNTPTPTRTPTWTPTATPSATDAGTATSTVSPTDTPTVTPSFTPTNSPTDTPTATPSFTPTNSPTDTPTATPSFTPTNSPTDTPTATPSFTPTKSPTDTPTATPTASPSHTPTATPSFTPTNSPTDTPTATPSPTPTQSPTATPSVTATASPTASPSCTPTETLSTTATDSPTATVTLTETTTASATVTLTATPSTSPTDSPTATLTATVTETRTASPTPDYAQSSVGKPAVGPVPAKPGQPICLYFDKAPFSTEWEVFNTAGQRVATLSFGNEVSQCMETRSLAPGIYACRLTVRYADGTVRTEMQKIAIVP